jgi:hypothetical protein
MMSLEEQYGAVFAELLKEERMTSICPGPPREEIREKLDKLTVEQLFSGQPVLVESMAEACFAGLWLYHAFLQKAHQISKGISNSAGDYWRGFVHRREPDFTKARHWMKKVGPHPIHPPLREEAKKLALKAPPHRTMDFLITQKEWDPEAFIDFCQDCIEGRSHNERLASQIQKKEWSLLFDYCYRQALGR